MPRFRMRSLCLVVALMATAGCKGSSSSTPTSPSGGGGTTTPTNRAPVITNATFTPAFGVAFLQLFTGAVSATDADGDALSYSWDFADGTSSTQQNPTKTYTGSGGTMAVRVTVSDGKAMTTFDPRTATASSTITVAVGSMTGYWSGTIDLNTCLPGQTKPVTATLTQSSTVVTGSVVLAQGLCSFQPGTAITDPAEPGTINAAGALNVRVKIPPYTDVYFRGTMDSSGKRITGGLYGSGHNGTPFVWNKS
jgi:PKD repeat protein